jgi:RNA-binding protein YhbY
MTQGQVQLGKHGITKNFIITLKHHFNKYNNIKVHVLKSAGHNKEDIKKYSEEILDSLGKNYNAKIIGFSIFIKRWRKAQR